MHKALNRMLKIRHRLIRAYLKFTRESSYKSKADYWPWVRIESAGASGYRVLYSGKLACTSLPFCDLCETGGEIAIVGSGPSVNLMRFDLISRLNCVLLNGAISLVDAYGIEPLACIIVDSTFAENRFDVLRCLPSGSNVILTPGVIRAVLERERAFLSKMNVYLTQNILMPVYNPGPRFRQQRDMAEQAGFSFDLDCGYVDGGTVMAVAIQLAYQVKAEKTYLIGLDIGNSASPRFYETQRDKLKCGLSDAYESSTLPFMKAASVIFSRSGIDIYNCSPCSRLPYDVIPYCDEFKK